MYVRSRSQGSCCIFSGGFQELEDKRLGAARQLSVGRTAGRDGSPQTLAAFVPDNFTRDGVEKMRLKVSATES